MKKLILMFLLIPLYCYSQVGLGFQDKYNNMFVSKIVPMSGLIVSGSVGIGTSTPEDALHIHSSTSAIAAQVSYQSKSANWATGSSGSEIGTVSNDPFKLKANNTTAMTILGTGDIGIGTNSPAYKLHVNSGTIRHEGQSLILGTTAVGDNDVSIFFAKDGDVSTQEIRYDDGGGSFQIRGGNALYCYMPVQSWSSNASLLMQNTSSEEVDEGRETYIDLRGQSLLPSVAAVSNARIYGGKDGAGQNHKGKIWININDGDDGTTPSIRALELDSTGLTVDRLTIGSTAATQHIAFSRAGWNYITAPSGGSFALNANGVGATTGNASLTIQSAFAGFSYGEYTASTTQTQGQQILAKTVCYVATVANANDVVTLPSCPTVSSIFIWVINAGANTLQIFPYTDDNLGAGVNTSTTLAAGSACLFMSRADAVNWFKLAF